MHRYGICALLFIIMGESVTSSHEVFHCALPVTPAGMEHASTDTIVWQAQLTCEWRHDAASTIMQVTTCTTCWRRT